jgi:hypothetical protein
MKRKTMLLALAAAFPLYALPLVAFAQGAGPGPGPGPGPGQGGRGAQGAGPRGDPERMEKRMRLARTLGLAEALDLDEAQALKLGQSVAKFDERRLALHKQMRESHDVLRRAAQGEKVAPADVDQAIQKALDARAQMQVVERETVAAVTSGLSPEKKARAVLFLAKFQSRFGGRGPGMHGGRGRGDMGPGMGPGRRGGMGMGPGQGPMGMGSGSGPGDWEDEED